MRRGSLISLLLPRAFVWGSTVAMAEKNPSGLALADLVPGGSTPTVAGEDISLAMIRRVQEVA